MLCSKLRAWAVGRPSDVQTRSAEEVFPLSLLKTAF